MPGIEVTCAGKTADVLVYERIGNSLFEDGITAKQFAEDLKAAGQVDLINLRINSPGGSVFEGMGIYTTLKSHKARVVAHVDGVAASMASVVAMSGDEIRMADGALMMIHDPRAGISGTSGEMRKQADFLDKVQDQIAGIYAERTGKPIDEIKTMMAATTWMDAAEAKANGFANHVTKGAKIAANFDSLIDEIPDRFKDRIVCETPPAATPQGAIPMSETAKVEILPAGPIAASLAQLEASCTGADEKFLLSQIRASATLAQAQSAWMAEQHKQLEATKAELAEVKAAAEKKPPAVTKPGLTTPVKTGPSGDATVTDELDPEAAWDAGVQAKIAAGKTKQQAVAAMVREQPDLHGSYVEAFNDKRRTATVRR